MWQLRQTMKVVWQNRARWIAVCVCVCIVNTIAFVRQIKAKGCFSHWKRRMDVLLRLDCSNNESENILCVYTFFERAKKTTAKHYIMKKMQWRYHDVLMSEWEYTFVCCCCVVVFFPLAVYTFFPCQWCAFFFYYFEWIKKSENQISFIHDKNYQINHCISVK